MSGFEGRIQDTAFAFRGYNVSNLGRSKELLENPAYSETVERVLIEASEICSDSTGVKTDLIHRIRSGTPTTLDTFAEDVSLIVGMEVAQIKLLEEFFDVDVDKAKLTFGYSIGELASLLVGKVFSMDEVLSVPLSLASDCASLAPDVTMAILFTRGPIIELERVHRLCARISCEGHGLLGPSAYLSPNTVLLLGEGRTVSRFKKLAKDELGPKVMLRRNNDKWPPLHTPLMWKKHIPSRSALLLHEVGGGFTAPTPPILSCVTGQMSYNDFNVRDHLIRWTDHPQLLWDVVYQTLSRGVELIVHVGPEPNLIPATYSRLSANVMAQMGGGFWGRFGSRFISQIARSWLSNVLSAKTALVRAPFVKHIVLEDWLLENAPKTNSVTATVTAK